VSFVGWRLERATEFRFNANVPPGTESSSMQILLHGRLTAGYSGETTKDNKKSDVSQFWGNENKGHRI
jgi:hypothetical protein